MQLRKNSVLQLMAPHRVKRPSNGNNMKSTLTIAWGLLILLTLKLHAA